MHFSNKLKHVTHAEDDNSTKKSRKRTLDSEAPTETVDLEETERMDV